MAIRGQRYGLLRFPRERPPATRLLLTSPFTEAAAIAYRGVQRNASDWSQVRPELGAVTQRILHYRASCLPNQLSLDGRAFLHSCDYQVDYKRRLLENILTGPLVVGQWIDMERYFSTVDNERFDSGSKVFHNVAVRFGVMTGNLSDLRASLPSQTLLDRGHPYHEPLRLTTVIEAPIEHAQKALESVVSVKHLVRSD